MANNKKKKSNGGISIGTIISIISIVIVLLVDGMPHISSSFSSNDIPNEVSVNYINKSYCDRYWDLSEDEQELYKILFEAASEGSTEATFDVSIIENMDNDDVFHIYKSLVFDHPEFFWLRTGYHYSTTKGKTTFIMNTWDFWKYTSDKDDYILELDQKVTEIVDAAEQYDSKYDQIKYVHDYIVNNTVYDHDAAKNNDKTVTDKETDLASTAYGVLVNGKAICGGYSKAFQMVMQRMGYVCGYVTGKSYNSYGEMGYHAWNYIQIDGDYYYMDVTWDDPIGSDPTESYLTYNYYCITSDQISSNHELDEDDEHAPYATGTKYAYRE